MIEPHYYTGAAAIGAALLLDAGKRAAEWMVKRCFPLPPDLPVPPPKNPFEKRLRECQMKSVRCEERLTRASERGQILHDQLLRAGLEPLVTIPPRDGSRPSSTL